MSLNMEEKIKLRELLIQVESKLILVDYNWVHRFTLRNNLSYKKITHKSSKTIQEVQEDILTFLQKVHELRKKWDIPVDLIINIDESALYFDQIPNYSYELAGVKHPGLKVSNSYKKRATMCLGVSVAI